MIRSSGPHSLTVVQNDAFGRAAHDQGMGNGGPEETGAEYGDSGHVRWAAIHRSAPSGNRFAWSSSIMAALDQAASGLVPPRPQLSNRVLDNSQSKIAVTARIASRRRAPAYVRWRAGVKQRGGSNSSDSIEQSTAA